MRRPQQRISATLHAGSMLVIFSEDHRSAPTYRFSLQGYFSFTCHIHGNIYNIITLSRFSDPTSLALLSSDICNVLKRKQRFVTSTICHTPSTLTVISCYSEVFPYSCTLLLQVPAFFSEVLSVRCLLTGSFRRHCPAGLWEKWALWVTKVSFRLFST